MATIQKILKNQTVSAIDVKDTGKRVPATPTTYTIPASDYGLWADSTDINTHIDSGDIVVNDGTSDLNATNAKDLLKFAQDQGFWNSNKILGVTVDNTDIANGKILKYNSTSGNLEYEVDDNNDPDAIHDNVSGEINAITEKTVVANDDLILIEDSAASNAKKKAKAGNLPYILVPIYLSDRGLSAGFEHVHTAFITKKDANDLMLGVVANVQITSSDADTGTSHTHTVTVTWDDVNHTFQSTSSTDQFHVHVDIPAGIQGVFGQDFAHVQSVSESTTGSTSYQTKLSYTSPSTLRAGDYRVDFIFGISNDGGKEFEAQTRHGTTEVGHVLSRTGHAAGAGQYMYQFISFYAEDISGTNTFDIRYRAPDGNNVRIGDAHIYFKRVK